MGHSCGQTSREMEGAGGEGEEYSGVIMANNNHNNDDRTLSFPRNIEYEGSSGQNSPQQEKIKKQHWPRGADFLASTWAFTLSFHSLLYLPVSIIQNGGLVFLLMYTLMLVVVGTPILMVEVFQGQYSGLVVSRLYRHLCPLLSGVGAGMAMVCLVRGVVCMCVAMWAGRGAVDLFYTQQIHRELLYDVVLHSNGTSIDNIGTIDTHVLLALLSVSLCVYALVAGGVKVVGKVCLLLVPLCYGLLITLGIRTCMDQHGPTGFLSLINPEWTTLSQATAWLEAAGHVILSLQVGSGVVSTYGSYNKYSHNIIRDCWVIIVGHVVWVCLSVFLVFSLLGVAYKEDTVNLKNLSSDHPLVSITGEGIWLGAITLVESSFNELTYGWLWAGLFFVLIIITSITSILGYVDVISNTFLSVREDCLKFKPLTSLITVLILSLICVPITTQGGIFIFYLLQTYIATWPLLFFTIITITTSVICHGTSYILKDISSMSRRNISHIVSSHFSVIITTITPILISTSLGWTLYSLSMENIQKPLQTFGIFLSSYWSLPLAWSLAILPIAPILFGAFWYIFVGARRGHMWIKNLRRMFRPTDTWHRNQHLQMFGDRNSRSTSSA